MFVKRPHSFFCPSVVIPGSPNSRSSPSLTPAQPQLSVSLQRSPPLKRTSSKLQRPLIHNLKMATVQCQLQGSDDSTSSSSPSVAFSSGFYPDTSVPQLGRPNLAGILDRPPSHLGHELTQFLSLLTLPLLQLLDVKIVGAGS